MAIGDQIKAAREKAGMTQTELGEKIGVSGVAIMRYEKGTRQPRADQLHRIAAAFGVPLHVLLDESAGDFLKQWFEEGNKTTKIPYEIGEKYGISIDIADKIVNDVVWEYREYIDALNDEERQLISEYRALNAEGKVKVLERLEELAQLPKYQRISPPPEDKK